MIMGDNHGNRRTTGTRRQSHAHVTRPEVPDDYSSYPPFTDQDGQKWAHTDPQAFEPPARQIPVYDPVSDDWADPN